MFHSVCLQKNAKQLTNVLAISGVFHQELIILQLLNALPGIVYYCSLIAFALGERLKYEKRNMKYAS